MVSERVERLTKKFFAMGFIGSGNRKNFIQISKISKIGSKFPTYNLKC
jgi:hypothetical protein